MMGKEVTQTNRLRQIEVCLRPETRFPVPLSDGYSVYSALLSVLDDVDTEVSARIHDSQLGSLHCSGLQGVFGDSERDFHKTMRPDESYRLTLGVVDPADAEIFQALVNALVLEGNRIELSHGALGVESFESENTTHEELLNQAGQYDDPTIEVEFQTTTCIEEAGEVTTMFPARWSVFNSLAGKWRTSCPEGLELELGREAVLASVIEKPDPSCNDSYTFETQSVLVNRERNADGENRNLFSQGFTGTCAYEFKQASESLQNAVTALALFGEFSGVGSAVARGCGQVNTEVYD